MLAVLRPALQETAAPADDRGEATARERPSHLVGSPTAFAMMLAIPGFRFEAYQGLYEVIVFGGASTPLAHLQELQKSGARLSSVYGQTETTGMVTYTDIGAPLELVSQTIGRPISGMELRVATPEGRPVASGETGEIQMRGLSVMSGYFNRPEATREAFTADGWLKTGDLGALRPDGEVAFAGRLKELFKSGGVGHQRSPMERVASCRPPTPRVDDRGHPGTSRQTVAAAMSRQTEGRRAEPHCTSRRIAPEHAGAESPSKMPPFRPVAQGDEGDYLLNSEPQWQRPLTLR